MIPKRAIGLVIAVIATALALANQHEVGIARDELVYMDAGGRYADWWLRVVTFEQAPAKDNITKTFGGPHPTSNNREHPPLMKTAFGLSHRLLHKRLGVDEVTAYRAPTALAHGVLAYLVFVMTLELWGLGAAVIASLLLVFLPRALFHASLAAFDAPIMTMWFATVFAYWRCMDGRKWPWQVGVAFGLALATKHNAVLLPAALGLHYLVVGYRAGGFRGMWLHRWRVIVSFGVVGPLTFLVLWPWLWLDPIDHVRGWLQFHLKHVHYNFEYLGQNWNAPPFPWHVALVTTLFTVPVVTLASALVGGGVWIAKRRELADARLPGLLLALSAAASMGPFFLGTTPIFGAEKHWMPALPTFCIAAGVGVVWAGRGVAARARGAWRVAVLPALASVVVLAAAVETATAQPYAMTWYNALAGGAPGGADLGMNRQFWGVAARGVLPVIASQAPPPKQTRRVYTHDAVPAWGVYHKQRRIPRSMPDAGHEVAGINNSQLAFVVHELHFNRHDYLIWRAYNTVQPIYVLRAYGVPIVSVYRRP